MEGSPPDQPTGRPAEDARFSAWLGRVILLDLEAGPDDHIHRLGFVFGDHAWGGRTSEALTRLATLAPQATAVVGHNVAHHDLRLLRQHAPDHPIHRLPIIDTLLLSPVAFPENPYHQLVKDYKLVRESRNNPVADARQAGRLLGDEWAEFTRLRAGASELFRVLHYLFGEPGPGADPLAAGFDQLFTALDGTQPAAAEVLPLARQHAAQYACRQRPPGAELLASVENRHLLAYALSWLRVAGARSVLPPWVRHRHPRVGQLIQEWRCTPCSDPGCAYCRREHNARADLKRYFGFDDFRPAPPAPTGGSLQQAIVESGLRGESLFAILPTGGGKSLCYQLPALVRHRHRGQLTIVISPLQALMKDQVDGLRKRTDQVVAAALYGMLTQPERASVLQQTRLGDLALLYVSPEQLRNKSFRDAVAQREIGCWVFDEAHCLSKWGHDFRPDYLYAARFIRELATEQRVAIPPVACFTATAKREVGEEIQQHFRETLQRELRTFEGGVERQNLRFRVEGTTQLDKLSQVRQILAEHLDPEAGGRGAAVVFRSRRQLTEATARQLRETGWRAEHFHAGLTAYDKKRIQDDFLAGRLDVICATNAFGMGIDKEDVRLVIHADVPGSLENYLQEAGRAGRDGRQAACVLLYDEADCEDQFRLGAMSQLNRRDIAQILKGVRRAARGSPEAREAIITGGEILRDEAVDTSIDTRSQMAETQVRTAVAWLERAGFLAREENQTNVFGARPRVASLDEARRRIAELQVQEPVASQWLAILELIFDTPPDRSLTIDQLALLPEIASSLGDLPSDRPPEPSAISKRIFKILDGMTKAGLVERDTQLSALVRHGVADPSTARLQQVDTLEQKLLDLLETTDPDVSGWTPLVPRAVNERLRQEGVETSVDQILSLLTSLANDGRGLAGAEGSLELRVDGRDCVRLKLNRGWRGIREISRRRRSVAQVVLRTILGQIPKGTPGRADLLVTFTYELLQRAVEEDLVLRSELRDIPAAVERALLFLHEQTVIELKQGLAIFRSAMTIRLKPEKHGAKYTNTHFEPLADHYEERVLQIHVMGEYARLGLQRIEAALELVLGYFNLPRAEFLRRFLQHLGATRRAPTTTASLERIVTSLENPAQERIVTARPNQNLLVLAGPGAGKSRVVVHRCAYLIRVHRVRPQAILLCCFNRRAAVELRRRLRELIGDDARGVTIQTYHGLALRLLGRTLAEGGDRDQPPDFARMITDATRLLRGELTPPGFEPDEVRDRLLAGFEHILVDEYQDIDEPQFELISALAGRTREDQDEKLHLLAVGDDDQSIYGFRGANVEFIRRFEEHYAAERHFLIENYRSTACIIEAANRVIAANRDRMKSGHPIRINTARGQEPPGGDFDQRDPALGGRVRLIRVPGPGDFGAGVLDELQRLRALGVGSWASCAVLCAQHEDLDLVRTRLEDARIPVRSLAARDSLPPLRLIREVRVLLDLLQSRRATDITPDDLAHAVEGIAEIHGHGNPWVRLLRDWVEEWRDEAGDTARPTVEVRHQLIEALAERRRDHEVADAVTLSTVHAAKGLEYDHVVVAGTWAIPAETRRAEELRRAFYVGLTRARRTLAVCSCANPRPTLPDQLAELGARLVAIRSLPDEAGPAAPVRYWTVLGLDELNLGFAGRRPAADPIHPELARLRPGDHLSVRPSGGTGVELVSNGGVTVARLSQRGAERWRPYLGEFLEARLVAVLVRTREGCAPEWQAGLLMDRWELPLVELVTRTRPPAG